MTKKILFMGILAGLLLLCGCQKVPENGGAHTDSEVVETFWSSSPIFPGTSDEESIGLPLPMFFFDGRLYRISSRGDLLYEENSWTYIGRVEKQVLVTETPAEEFTSNYVRQGAPVYSNGEDNYLIAILQNDRYVVYEWMYSE